MNGAAVVAEILKREGVTDLPCYPRNSIIEPAAELNIRPYIVRQERTGMHMADAISRVTMSAWPAPPGCAAPGPSAAPTRQ